MNKFLQKTKKTLSVLFLTIGFATFIFAQTKTISIEDIKIPTEVDFQADLKTNVCENDERLAAVKKLFIERGAGEDEIKIEEFKNVKNLVVTKKGKSNEIVVVGAHYDKTRKGCGAIDNWTGIVIIANLYQTLKNFPTEKTYLFVAFGREEEGLVGSRAMAKAIPKESRANYCSMINFDSFGFSYPQVLTNTSSSKMTEAAKQTAEKMNISLKTASLRGGADADSSSFLDKDIPAVTLHGLSNQWQQYLHGDKDKLENINTKSVYIGYRFGLAFVFDVDTSFCGVFRK